MYITDCKIITCGEVIEGFAVKIRDGIISQVVPQEQISYDECMSLSGGFLCPGFIDVQVNGGGGYLFNDCPTTDCINKIYAAHRKCGTVMLCPTFITDSHDKLKKAIHAAEVCDKNKIPAIHIEGFYISKEKSGIHNREFIRRLDDDEAEFIVSTGKTKKILTIAPEAAEKSAVSKLKENGIIIFGGHTNASYEVFTEFIQEGVVGATHLYNAMSAMQSRFPGVVGAVFDSDVCKAGIIADNAHSSFACVRIAKKIMGKRLFLVTDAMPPACSDMTEYYLYGEHIKVENGVCVADNGTIAGSCLSMARAVKNCVEHCNISLTEAVDMASLYPAEVLGIADRFGRVKEGYAANFTVLDDKLMPTMTFVNGQIEKCR